MVELIVSFGSILLAIVFFVAAFLILKILKNILANTVLGVIALLAINFLSQYTGAGLNIPLTLATVAVSAILGLAGVGILLILAVAGIKLP
ncbi:MAG: pro-sigmaK processing inhibitor BofA family protein [Candidatus Micrarchaeota archaeon]|nr:pro-sigmaK processing inhibitor BofA family protein [Candidatus Micrarchaeota archaeon]